MGAWSASSPDEGHRCQVCTFAVAVLKSVKLSAIQDLDASCNTILPAEERYNLTFEPPRPSGPSRGRLSFGDPNTKSQAFGGLVMFRHAQALQQILEFVRQSGANAFT
jgi:hypothetical protein